MLDFPEFDAEAQPRPMVERDAGSNVWFQATILQESKTELRVVLGSEFRAGWGWGGGGGTSSPVLCSCAGVQATGQSMPQHYTESIAMPLAMGRMYGVAHLSVPPLPPPSIAPRSTAMSGSPVKEWIDKRSSRIWRGPMHTK